MVLDEGHADAVRAKRVQVEKFRVKSCSGKFRVQLRVESST
jgi:hypothetical protein